MEKLTIGKQLQNEVEDALYDGNILKHWSLRDYKVRPIYLDAILEDVKTYWNEEVRFREGFEIDKVNKIVNIPNFYIKIDGTYENNKDYKNLRNKFLTGVVYHNTPLEIETKVFKSLNQPDFQKILNKIKKDKNVNLEDLKKISYPNNLLFELNSYILNYLIEKLNEFIQINKDDYDITSLISQFVNLDENIYKELNNWDFGFRNPKITIINENKQNIDLLFLEYIDFFNFLGFDIIFFSERGENFPNKKNHYNGLITIVLDKFIKSKSKEDEIKTKNKKLMIASSILIIIVGFLLFSLVSFLVTRPKTIYKYKENIKSGEIVTSNMIKKETISYKKYENGMVTNSKDIVGKIAKNDYKSKSIIYDDQLYNLDDYIGSVDSNIPKTISLNKKKKNITLTNVNKNVNLMFEIYKDNESLGKTKELGYNEKEDIELYSLLKKGKQNLTIKIFVYQKNGIFYKDFTKDLLVYVDEKSIEKLQSVSNTTTDAMLTIILFTMNIIIILVVIKRNK